MGKISLFEIGKEFQRLYDMANDMEVNEETGEIIDNSDTLKELLEQIQGDLTDKLDSCNYIRKELDANADTLANEIKRLQAKKQALENRSKRLKELMQETMIVTGETKLKGKFTFSIGTRKALQLDENLTPEFFDQNYVRTKKEFDKKKITDDLKNGVEIKGAKMTEKVNFSIR